MTRKNRVVTYRTSDELEDAQQQLDEAGIYSEADWETLTLRVFG